MKLHTTLLQWTALDAIVRNGGFEKAARALHMSQSSVSYAVAQLQEALGVPLLEQKGRRACLTGNGALLLDEALPLLRGMRALEDRARVLRAGGESRVTIAVDSIFPEDLLFAAFVEFRAAHPHVHVELQRSIRMSPETAFHTHHAQLCIGTCAPGRYLSDALLDVRLIAVAHRNHPLLAAGGRITERRLAEHPLVSIGESETPPAEPVSGEAWKVNTISAAIAAVRSGFCFGWLPEDRIEAQLATGELRRLPLASGRERRISLSLVLDPARLPGPATAALAEILGRHLRDWNALRQPPRKTPARG